MARRLFFVPEIRRGAAEITGADAEHLVRVLRAEPGQRFDISDNNEVYAAEIETARKSLVTFRVIEKLPPRPATAAVYLYPALFKFDHFEWMIEKATELGVTGVHPFEATRSDRGLAQAAAKRIERWRRIALEASQQSRRAVLPTIEEAKRFDAVIQNAPGVKLMLDESEGARPVLSLVDELWPRRVPQDEISILLGPEGGWTDSERIALTGAGWRPCSLGQTILRAETAAIAGLGVVNALWTR